MSKGNKGFGLPIPIEPASHKGKFPWWLIEIPFVLFFSTLIGIATGWFLVMIDNYGMDRMPGLLVSIFERQGGIMIVLPMLLTMGYIAIKNIRKKYGSSRTIPM